MVQRFDLLSDRHGGEVAQIRPDDLNADRQARRRALDRNGEPFEVEATELLARCLQHEIDHLHGKLFIDYLSIFKKKAAMAQWEEEKRAYPELIRTVQSPAEIAQHHDDRDL